MSAPFSLSLHHCLRVSVYLAVFSLWVCACWVMSLPPSVFYVYLLLNRLVFMFVSLASCFLCICLVSSSLHVSVSLCPPLFLPLSLSQSVRVSLPLCVRLCLLETRSERQPLTGHYGENTE